MPDREERYSVRTLQLEPGDLLIAGSDGRDDLMIENADGVASMCENETAFLEVVRAASGDLAQIREGLSKRGELRMEE